MGVMRSGSAPTGVCIIRVRVGDDDQVRFAVITSPDIERRLERTCHLASVDDVLVAVREFVADCTRPHNSP